MPTRVNRRSVLGGLAATIAVAGGAAPAAAAPVPFDEEAYRAGVERLLDAREPPHEYTPELAVRVIAGHTAEQFGPEASQANFVGVSAAVVNLLVQPNPMAVALELSLRGLGPFTGQRFADELADLYVTTMSDVAGFGARFGYAMAGSLAGDEGVTRLVHEVRAALATMVAEREAAGASS